MLIERLYLMTYLILRGTIKVINKGTNIKAGTNSCHLLKLTKLIAQSLHAVTRLYGTPKETHIFRELSIEIESSLIELKSSLIEFNY